MTALSPLPDFDLTGLSVSELHTLWEYLRPMSSQFDSCAQGGAPFTKPITSGPFVGAVDDTQIGETVSIIYDWSCRQLRRVIEAMAETPADYLLIGMKAEVLMFDAAQSEDWDAAAVLVEKLRAEEQALRAAAKEQRK